MRLTACRPLLPLLLLCFNCLAAEYINSEFGDHDATKETLSPVESMGRIPKIPLERSEDDPSKNFPLAEFPCPVASAIKPCVCLANSNNNRLTLDCSSVKSEEELAAVFQQQFPIKELYEFRMHSNSAIKTFHNFMNGITFEILTIYPGPFVLDTVAEYFLLNLKDTVKEIWIRETKIITDTFPFLMLPLMTELSRLSFVNNDDINWIPPIRAPKLSSFGVLGSPVELLENGTLSVGTREMLISLSSNQIRSIEPGSIFFADDESAASSEVLQINLDDNRIQSLQAGTFHLRNGSCRISIDDNQISSIEPGTFVLPNAPDSMDLLISLGNNLLTTIDEAVFGNLMPFVSDLQLYGNPLTCGCDVTWLIQNTTLMSVVDGNTRCADGTLLHDLNPQDFVDWCQV